MERLAFGDIVVDLAGREVLRAGRSVRLSPKAFQLLSALIEKRPAAVSKQQLQDLLWPGTFVVEKNITNLIGEIRTALGDNPAHPRFIRTVHRFGYAFHESSARGAADTSRTYSHNLPQQLTTFIGREREITEILRRLHTAGLLTLTGTGGCGKTRLALAVARDLVQRFYDGVWMIDLASLTDPGLMTQTVASVLHVRAAPDKPLDAALSDAVRDRQLLLILDNCEHLIPASARLAERLIGSSPKLTILATSREALGIAGESVWPVSTLSLPDASPQDDGGESESVRLFMVRAAAVDPEFTVTPANAAIVANVCRALDGIPLAIELAAARLQMMSVDEIHSRLNDRFQLLSDGTRTLEATIDWSYNLLEKPEALLMRRLSVFAGGWDIEAAKDVCSGDAIAPEDVPEFLVRLADKSLLVVEDDSGSRRRYRFLETLRQYGYERLTRSGEVDACRTRHLNYFLELTRRAESELSTASQTEWLALLRSDRDNLRASLEFSGGETTLELANNLFWFWLKNGYYEEGRRWLERAIDSAPNASPGERAKAMMALGNMLFFLGDFARARSSLEESARLAGEASDPSVGGFALGMSALAAMELGDFAEGMRLASEGLEIARHSATPWLQGPSLALLAYVALNEGDLDRAGALHEEASELCRAQGEIWGLGITLIDLGLLRLIQERHDEARALCAESISLAGEFDDRRALGWSLGLLSGVDAAQHHPLRAARLCGAMEALLQSVGATIQPTFKTWIVDRYFDSVREHLGPDGFDRAILEGRKMPVPKMMELAREATG